MRRVCPACSKRTAGLVTPDCPVCKGDGTLTLHPAAMAWHEPVVVAEAVDLALEVMAREVDTASTLSDDRAALLAKRAAELHRARVILKPGILAPLPAPAPPPEPTRRRSRSRAHQMATPQSLAADPETAAEAYAGGAVKAYDAAVAHAAPHHYQVTDRPLMRGLPVLSAAGYPSHLARVADPQDAYADTPKLVNERTRRTRQATILVAAVPHVLEELAR